MYFSVLIKTQRHKKVIELSDKVKDINCNHQTVYAIQNIGLAYWHDRQFELARL